jgi:hypothetical protein
MRSSCYLVDLRRPWGSARRLAALAHVARCTREQSPIDREHAARMAWDRAPLSTATATPTKATPNRARSVIVLACSLIDHLVRPRQQRDGLLWRASRSQPPSPINSTDHEGDSECHPRRLLPSESRESPEAEGIGESGEDDNHQADDNGSPCE